MIVREYVDVDDARQLEGSGSSDDGEPKVIVIDEEEPVSLIETYRLN